MSERGGRCQEVTKLIMVDLEGVAELEAGGDLVVGVELVAETLEASSASAAINSATSGRTVLHQALAEAMLELGNVIGAFSQDIRPHSAERRPHQNIMEEQKSSAITLANSGMN